ncbi:class D sortase [Alkaliphilus pronyensis]|uniref:Class D sortase n=1 Tax=Alkaliphilus pronyensis TaxID=1482732 RepID=A0A6I0EZA1_9FIRM|nr:class D sortase [Alkaliphilus pronyensis]KAB3531912.1 class D sortase [Alkaliphilus pronyensis]
MRRKLSVILIILGLIVFTYPLLERGFTWYMQRKVMEEYEKIAQLTETIESEAVESNYFQLQRVLGDEMRELMEAQAIENSDHQKNQKPAVLPIGVLKIDEINLNLPILEGTSELNLKIGAAWLKETTPIGEVGNTALAAHRSHTYGRFFHRLDELEVGDEIQINKDKKNYRYVVYKKHLVEPEDISVLNRNQKDKILTLITCHPIDTATHRLIVHAVLEELD